MLTDMPLHLFHIQSGNIAQSQSPDIVDNSRYHWLHSDSRLLCTSNRNTEHSQYSPACQKETVKVQVQSAVLCDLDLLLIRFLMFIVAFDSWMVSCVPPRTLSEDCAVSIQNTCLKKSMENCASHSLSSTNPGDVEESREIQQPLQPLEISFCFASIPTCPFNQK